MNKISSAETTRISNDIHNFLQQNAEKLTSQARKLAFSLTACAHLFYHSKCT